MTINLFNRHLLKYITELIITVLKKEIYVNYRLLFFSLLKYTQNMEKCVINEVIFLVSECEVKLQK